MSERRGLRVCVWIFWALLCVSEHTLGALTMRLPNIEARSGGTVDVPITLAGASGIGAIQFEVVFDPAVITADTVTRGPLAGGNALVDFNPSNPGRLVVGLATLQDITGDGIVATARFKVVGNEGQSSTLAIANGEAWEGKTHQPVVLRTEAGNLKVIGGLPWWWWIGALIAIAVFGLLLLLFLWRRRRRDVGREVPAAAAGPAAVPAAAPAAAPRRSPRRSPGCGGAAPRTVLRSMRQSERCQLPVLHELRRTSRADHHMMQSKTHDVEALRPARVAMTEVALPFKRSRRSWMRIARVSAGPLSTALVLAALLSTEGILPSVNAQALNAAEQDKKREYEQRDAAYGREHPRTPGSPAAGGVSSTLSRPGQQLRVNHVAGYGASTRINEEKWIENRRCNFAGQDVKFYGDTPRYLTPDQMIKAIQASDVFFFSGHAGQASAAPGMHVLVGSPPDRTGWLTSSAVRQGLEGRQGPRLVIVNGCKTTDLNDGVPLSMRMSSSFGITDQTIGRAYLGWPELIVGTFADDEIGRMLTIWTTPGPDGRFPTLEEARIKQDIKKLTIVGDRNLRYKAPQSGASGAAPAGAHQIVAQCPNPGPAVTDLLEQALNSLPACPGMQLGPACFQKFTVHKDGLAATTFLAREPAAGSERTDVKLIGWTDAAAASRDFQLSLDGYKAKRMNPRSAFESLTPPGQPETGGFEYWLDSNFGGEAREAGRASGVLSCGNVVGHLTMFISAGHRGPTGQALVDATKAQMKGLLQQIGGAVRASGACAT